MGTCRAAAAAGVLYRRCICSFGWVWKCLTSLLLNPNASASCPAGTPGGVAIKGVIGRVCAGRQGKPGWQSEIPEIRGVHWGRNGSVLRAGRGAPTPFGRRPVSQSECSGFGCSQNSVVIWVFGDFTAVFGVANSTGAIDDEHGAAEAAIERTTLDQDSVVFAEF